MLGKVAAAQSVAAVQSPFGPRGAAQISRDGKTAFATVDFTKLASELPPEDIKQVMSLAQAARAPGLEVELGGNAIAEVNRTPPANSEIFGLIAAAIIILIAFGSLLGMALPLITAITALTSGTVAIALLSHAISIPSMAPILAALIGLGVGIDYALFIVTRHRDGLKGGASPEESAVRALNTSGRAVLFAGGTVCIALLGLLVLSVGFLNGMAYASVLMVVFTMAAAITLLPAMFGFMGVRVLSKKERRRLAAGELGRRPRVEPLGALGRLRRPPPGDPRDQRPGRDPRPRQPDHLAAPGLVRRGQRPRGLDHAQGLRPARRRLRPGLQRPAAARRRDRQRRRPGRPGAADREAGQRPRRRRRRPRCRRLPGPSWR